MTFPRGPVVLAVLAVSAGLAGCSAPPPVVEAARPLSTEEECSRQVDVQMRLRGYPRRPSPETPQYKYRQEIHATCLRQKDMALEPAASP